MTVQAVKQQKCLTACTVDGVVDMIVVTTKTVCFALHSNAAVVSVVSFRRLNDVCKSEFYIRECIDGPSTWQLDTFDQIHRVQSRTNLFKFFLQIDGSQ